MLKGSSVFLICFGLPSGLVNAIVITLPWMFAELSLYVKGLGVSITMAPAPPARPDMTSAGMLNAPREESVKIQTKPSN